MEVTDPRAARIELRLTHEHKERIERAAELVGQSLTRFATETLVARAQEIIAERGAPREPRRPTTWVFSLPEDVEG
jgi:uncharacterized protein (DUF1778 family)